MPDQRTRRDFGQYKKLTFFQRYMRLSRTNRAILGLLIGTYAMIGLFNYEKWQNSEPPEEIDEKNIAISIMPFESAQTKYLREKREREKKLAEESNGNEEEIKI